MRYNINIQVSLCSSRLLTIKVPDFVSRIPKSFADLAQWKGIEILSASSCFPHMIPQDHVIPYNGKSEN